MIVSSAWSHDWRVVRELWIGEVVVAVVEVDLRALVRETPVLWWHCWYWVIDINSSHVVINESIIKEVDEVLVSSSWLSIRVQVSWETE